MTVNSRRISAQTAIEMDVEAPNDELAIEIKDFLTDFPSIKGMYTVTEKIGEGIFDAIMLRMINFVTYCWNLGSIPSIAGLVGSRRHV